MADHLEIERKFDVDPGFTLPDLSAVPGVAAVTGPEVHQLTAVYYDTPDLLLAAHSVTLRRRTGGTDAGWHLKLPAGQPGSRREYQEPLGDEIPARLSALVGDITAGAPLAPIATLSTKRRVLILRSSDGSPRAEIADDTVTATREGSARPTLVWREIEVESADSETDVMDAAGKALTSAGARTASSGSKLGRVLKS
ncbi:MAG: CYTH domain-containing protein [Streptosporangiaceae bacterium]|jgi:inorganic triphosphatase YgiF